ncbi:MAG: hypothetical protein LW595_01200 [Rickettsiales bacterium]|nr:hypothetical protein [Rickettsiales bacterium]
MDSKQHLNQDLKKIYDNCEHIFNCSLLLLDNHLSSIVDKKPSCIKMFIAVEIEFYLIDENNIQVQEFKREEFIDHFNCSITKKFPLIIKIEKEQGDGQVEIKTAPTFDLKTLACVVAQIKEESCILAKMLNLSVVFEGKPFSNDCGNAMQFNLSFWSGDKNILDDYFGNLELQEFGFICQLIGNLLAYTNNGLLLMAPEAQDYQRFSIQENKNLHQIGKYNSPTRLCFGVNNRTTAIRVVKNNQFDGIDKSLGTRLEYRVPSANCNFLLAISVLMIIITNKDSQFLASNINKLEIFGNAFLQQYQHLVPIIDNYQQALENFFNNNFIYNKMKLILENIA